MKMENSKPIYEGKAKQLFEATEKDHYVLHFKNSATAFNGKKRAEIEEKGSLNQRISARIFQFLQTKGIESHYVKSLSDVDMLVRAVKIIPVEVVIRNRAAGSLCKRLGVEEKKMIDPPLVEYFYKSDVLDDPLITEDHIRWLRLATEEDLQLMRTKALAINAILKSFFEKLGILLVDFKVEFGKTREGEIILADEITPDGCRLWDMKTFEILDKDRFRKDLGGLIEAYRLILSKLEKELQ